MLAMDRLEGVCRYRGPYPLSRRQGRRAVGFWEDGHEFLAAPAAHGIDAAYPRGERAGKRLQGGIARRVAVCVVEQLEVIDVQEEDRAGCAVPSGMGQGAIERFHQRSLVVLPMI